MKHSKNRKYLYLFVYFSISIFFYNSLYSFFYSTSSSSEPRYKPRILGRRFALTPTSYKYLDIGISVGSMSYVEILLGDNRGNHIILPYGTWKAFIEKRMDIERFVQATAAAAAASLTIHELVIQLTKMGKENIVKLTSHNISLCFKPKTILFLFELEHCVEHTYYSLCQNTYDVSEKFKQFVTFLRQNCINKCDAAKILRDKCDKNSIIECELVAYALDHIMYNVSY